MQQDKPEDFVIATGVQHSVRQFVEMAAAASGISIEFKGSGARKWGVASQVSATGGREPPKCKLSDIIVKVDPRY